MSKTALPSLTPRERRMAGVFAAVVLGLAAWFLWDALQARHEAALRRQQALRREIADATRWIQEKALWEARAQWLAGGMPPALSANEASSKFLEQLQKSAGQQKLQISQQVLLDSEVSSDLLSVGARLVFRGSLKDTAHWLAEHQQPGEFVEFSLLELRPLPEAGQVECTAQLRKWFVQGKPAGAPLVSEARP